MLQLLKVPTAEVCDATADDQIINAGLQIFRLIIYFEIQILSDLLLSTAYVLPKIMFVTS
ncbi:MAG: hypothetical protein JWR18_2486 [Segetibacter sp.]|nr:hypothetical protein [Segetibacter sp.]